MARPTKGKKGGGKLSRTETVTVRLDPILKTAVSLAAQLERRSVSAFIEWAVERAVKEVYSHHPDFTAWRIANDVWDADPAQQFLNTALNYPPLLTFDERLIERFLTDHVFGKLEKIEKDGRNRPIAPLTRRHWPSILKAVEGELSVKELAALMEEDTSNDG